VIDEDRKLQFEDVDRMNDGIVEDGGILGNIYTLKFYSSYRSSLPLAITARRKSAFVKSFSAL
jgi:hypothetical protein